MKNIKRFIISLIELVFYFYIFPDLLLYVLGLFNISIQSGSSYELINLLIYICGIGYMYFKYFDSLIKDFKDFIKRFFKILWPVFKTWLFALVIMIIMNLTVIYINGSSIAANESYNRELLARMPVMTIIFMVIFAPLVEELFFRRNLKDSFKNEKSFIFTSAILFGLGHIISFIDFSSISKFLETANQLLFLLPYSSMGYFLAKIYVEEKNIFASITMHMIHNGFAVLIVLLGSKLL